jgi:DNA-binding transcriptional regulator PaaX
MKKVLSKVGWEVLDLIKTLGEISATIVETPYGQLRLRPRTTYYKTLRKLEIKGLVKKSRRGRINLYSLTSAGRELIHKKIKLVRRSDGLSTIVIFDVPEDQSKQRTLFRRYLQQNGFVSLQKSVLISPNQIQPELKELIRELKLNNFVTVIDGRIRYNI